MYAEMFTYFILYCISSVKLCPVWLCQSGTPWGYRVYFRMIPSVLAILLLEDCWARWQGLISTCLVSARGGWASPSLSPVPIHASQPSMMWSDAPSASIRQRLGVFQLLHGTCIIQEPNNGASLNPVLVKSPSAPRLTPAGREGRGVLMPTLMHVSYCLMKYVSGKLIGQPVHMYGIFGEDWRFVESLPLLAARFSQGRHGFRSGHLPIYQPVHDSMIVVPFSTCKS